MQHEPRATWRSYDPDLNRVDIHGDRPLKPHERAARDIGLLALDMVRAEWHKMREASPDAHVWRWIWRTHEGGVYYAAKCDAARAQCQGVAPLDDDEITGGTVAERVASFRAKERAHNRARWDYLMAQMLRDLRRAA
jgi:hypothetical protein